MSLAQAIAAVRSGLAYSTTMPPGGPRTPQVNPQERPKSAVEQWLEQQAGGGGTGSQGTWSLVKGSDGKMYERNSTTGETRLAPDQFQPSDPTSGLYPYDPQSDLVGRPADQPSQGAVLDFLSNSASGFADQPAGGWNTYLDPGTGLLHNAQGDVLPQWQQKFIGAGVGGGGALTAAQSATLARQAEMDKWNKVIDYITALQNERTATASLRNARNNALIAAAPDLATGNEFRGGFGPYGGYTLLERMQGGPGLPVMSAPSITPLDLGPAPADPGLVDKWLGPLAGVSR